MIKLIIVLILTTFISCTSQEESIPKSEIIELKETLPSENLIPDGDFVQKYPNGAVRIKGQMLDNKREGFWTAYYNNSVKQSENTYEKNVLHGRTASFYTNGQVRYIGYFLGGKRDGKWDFYSEDGQIVKSEMYVKGMLTK